MTRCLIGVVVGKLSASSPFALINRGPVINPSASAVAYSNPANDRCILNLLVLIETGALYQTRRRLSVKYCWPFSIACSCPRHPQPGSPRRLVEAIAKPNQPVRAERHTRTVSNDADIRPSLVRLGRSKQATRAVISRCSPEIAATA